jgi:hypothetical protein
MPTNYVKYVNEETMGGRIRAGRDKEKQRGNMEDGVRQLQGATFEQYQH